MRILVVDDDDSVLTSTVRLVEALGHTVVPLRDGVAAKKLISAGEIFDAIITDNCMPGMKGVDFLDWFRTEFELIPITKLILCTGDHTPDVTFLLLRHKEVRVLLKPFGFQTLCEVLS
jgi:CheY-like chemotaxis protein